MNSINILTLKISGIPHNDVLDSNIFNISFVWFKRHCFEWFLNVNPHSCQMI